MAKRRFSGEHLSDRKLLVFAGLVIGFSILGPFGTYELLDFWPRLSFWSVAIFGIGICMHFCIVLALTGETFAILPRWARIAVGAMVAAIPSAGIVLFLSGYFYEQMISTRYYPLIWFQVASVGTLASLLEFRPRRDARPGVPAQESEPAPAREPDPVPDPAPAVEPPPVPAPSVPARTQLHDRLSGGAAADIISLSMRDHYVEITSDRGSELVLMRLADAMKELSGLPGQRIHRSHWVAEAHMRGLEKRGKKHVLRLSNGTELPVSASYLEAVSAAIDARSAPVS